MRSSTSGRERLEGRQSRQAGLRYGTAYPAGAGGSLGWRDVVEDDEWSIQRHVSALKEGTQQHPVEPRPVSFWKLAAEREARVRAPASP